MEPLVGRLQQLLEGRYAIERELGRGGMATVYLARDLRHPRQVAIKLLQPELATAVTAERFLREIQITAQLQHPHILTLIDSGASGGLVYYVMPHVDGESLRERLIWEKQLALDQALHIAREVASAMAYAHARGVIHRDIKPENILLSAGHAVVADFGIARAVRESGQQAITQVGLPLGTPAYMSPEQAAGKEDIDQRSDLYSLGCVLFEMLAGRPPFVADTVGKVILAHLIQAPPPLHSVRSTAPAELNAIIQRALAKQREQRFQTAAEFAEALSLVEAAETLERKTPTGARPRVTAAGAQPHGRTPLLMKQLLILGGAVGSVVLLWLGLRGGGNRRKEVVAAPPGVVQPADGAGVEFLSSIGVRPLDPLEAGGDDQARVLSRGLTEEISALLTRIKGLRVISRTTMEAVDDKRWTSRQVADSLGLRHLLEGSVQRAGPNVVVTLRLVDARNDRQLWGQSYTRSVRDILMVRQEIARDAVQALVAAVPGLQMTAPDGGSRNPNAVEQRARGLELTQRADPAQLDQAIQAFERALQLDPTYAQAAAGLSDALRLYVNLGFGGTRDPYQTLGLALRWAERAVELDSSLADGWAARGSARIYAGDRPELALDDLDQAVALAPSSGTVRVFRGLALARLHRYKEALKEVQLGAVLDPLNAATRGGGVALTALAARRYDVGLHEAELAATRDPEFFGWRHLVALAALLQGDAKRCLDVEGDRTDPLTAICLHRAGRADQGRRLADSLATRYRAGQADAPYSLGFLAAYYAQQHDAARAVEWLERSFSVSPTGFDFRLLDCGLFDPVRDDPVYTAGIERVFAGVRERLSKSVGR